MVNFKRTLCELYGEPDDGTFTHEGHDYNLNGVLTATLGMQVEQFPVDLLKWILKYDPMHKEDAERIKNADLDAPIIIIKTSEGWVVLDGIHRLAKALKTGVRTLPSIEVTQELIDRYRVK